MHSVSVRKEIADRVLQRRSLLSSVRPARPGPHRAGRDRHAGHVLRAGQSGRGAGLARHRRADQRVVAPSLRKLGVPGDLGAAFQQPESAARATGSCSSTPSWPTPCARRRWRASRGREAGGVDRAGHRPGDDVSRAEEPLQRADPGLVAARAHRCAAWASTPC